MKCRTVIFATAFLGLTSCSTTFHGVTPVYPEVGSLGQPTNVESLQPTLCWRPSSDSGATYDVVIYEGIKVESWMEGIKRSIGDVAYYREGLNETEHKVETPLKPNTEYYWSVRERRRSEVSAWSRYDYKAYWGTGYAKGERQLFMFKTPKM